LLRNDVPFPACRRFDRITVNYPNLSWKSFLLIPAQCVGRFAVEYDGPFLGVNSGGGEQKCRKQTSNSRFHRLIGPLAKSHCELCAIEKRRMTMTISGGG